MPAQTHTHTHAGKPLSSRANALPAQASSGHLRRAAPRASPLQAQSAPKGRRRSAGASPSRAQTGALVCARDLGPAPHPQVAAASPRGSTAAVWLQQWGRTAAPHPHQHARAAPWASREAKPRVRVPYGKLTTHLRSKALFVALHFVQTIQCQHHTAT